MTTRNLSARMRAQAKEARAQRQADARRRASHPGNDNKLVCRSFTGAKLVRADGQMVFVPGKSRTYVELRSDLEHPGGKPTGAMPGSVRAQNVTQPVPNKKPVATRKKGSTRVPGWAGVVAATPGDRVGGSATRSVGIKPPIVRNFTGAKAGNAKAADTRAEGIRANVHANWNALHVSR